MTVNMEQHGTLWVRRTILTHHHVHTQLLTFPKAFGHPYFPKLFVVQILLPGRQWPRMQQQQGHSGVEPEHYP